MPPCSPPLRAGENGLQERRDRPRNTTNPVVVVGCRQKSTCKQDEGSSRVLVLLLLPDDRPARRRMKDAHPPSSSSLPLTPAAGALAGKYKDRSWRRLPQGDESHFNWQSTVINRDRPDNDGSRLSTADRPTTFTRTEPSHGMSCSRRERKYTTARSGTCRWTLFTGGPLGEHLLVTGQIAYPPHLGRIDVTFGH
jgi:hypothetical protein